MLNNIKGVIFDLDGTLIDSMGVWTKIDYDYLSAKSISVPNNLKEEITHLSFTQTAQYFKDRFNLNDNIESIINCWNSMAYNEYANNIKLKDGVLDYLTYLKSNNIKIALATSNSYTLLEAVLKNNNIYNFFDAITITDEVKVSKANPDIYLLSAEKLNIHPNECLVFEDIVQALKGAKSANMQTVAVFDNQSEDEIHELKEISDYYIDSYISLLNK
ncbi:MAG: HAD family hydrolase [Clostridium sp.]